MYLLRLQAHALIYAHCPSWLAWIVSVIFVLLESALMDLIFFAIILPIFQDALFDATLRARGLDRMFATRTEVSNLLLCCRGLSSGLAMVWLLILAQVQRRKKKKIKTQHRFKIDFDINDYGSTPFDTRCRHIYILLYQWLGCMVS